ncbi:hypothetical protein SAMN05444487_101359 [Marininema mesophilum]|uniref:Uncharacterized protein n=1 Tax=Marininema mesophilum TaxID=1048340 RepID=A0A1H2R1L9_9BACL|nr:hypothetical protein SAMN05444487_101359 [Marininema mesophilum]
MFLLHRSIFDTMEYVALNWKVNQAIAGGVPKGPTGGKSELHRAGCRLTAGGGNSKASATEMKTADGDGVTHLTGKDATVR